VGCHDPNIEMPFWGPPESHIALARKRGILFGVFRATPSSFTWNGHLVEVDEAWVVQSLRNSPSKYELYFTLRVDGKREDERHGPYLDHIDMLREDGTKYLYGIGRSLCAHKSEALKAYIPLPGFGSHHRWPIYSAAFRDNVPELFRLRAVRNVDWTTDVLSGHVLTFELQSGK
jgi:hypothetical protein